MAISIRKLLVLALITTSLTGCGSGRTAETRMIKQVTDGVEGQSNEVRLRNVLIVKDEMAQGILIGTLVNWSDEADALTGITIDDQAATLSAGSFNLAKNKPVIFAGPSANADAFIPQITNAIGERVDITFSFAKASPVKLNALIVQNDGIYSELLRYKPATATS
jgi:hypothetical protein